MISCPAHHSARRNTWRKKETRRKTSCGSATSFLIRFPLRTHDDGGCRGDAVVTSITGLMPPLRQGILFEDAPRAPPPACRWESRNNPTARNAGGLARGDASATLCTQRHLRGQGPRYWLAACRACRACSGRKGSGLALGGPGGPRGPRGRRRLARRRAGKVRSFQGAHVQDMKSSGDGGLRGAAVEAAVITRPTFQGSE